jgi:hypothetical protein
MKSIKLITILLFLSHTPLFAQTNNIILSTIPRNVYKINNGANNESNMESWFYRVSVITGNEKVNKTDSISLQYFNNERLSKEIKKYNLSNDLKGSKPLTILSDIKEDFGFFFQFVEFVSDSINKMRFTMYCTNDNNIKITKTLDIPINYYVQKNKYILPVKGKIFVPVTFLSKGGHPEWSQSYAYDVTGMGENYNLFKDTLYNNASFEGWGREIFAPADGIVKYSRDDIPDNSYPNAMSLKELFSYPDSIYAVAGNCVVIDHGNNEYSLLAHLQHGSVKIKIGDSVKKGVLVGLMGNSGHSTGVHLHFHIMSGEKPFQCDGLPIIFDNSEDKWMDVGLYDIE